MQIDAVLAAKLAALLKKVAHGRPLAVAAAEAGVSMAELERIIKEVDRELWKRAAETKEVYEPLTRATKPEKPAAKKKTKSKKAAKGDGLALVAYADGGSRGNPGPAACAALILDASGAELLRRGRRIGKATNNVAEYEGVLLALELCRELHAADVTLRLDSELVVRQLEGRYKVKHADLAKLHGRAVTATRDFESFTVEHVRRKDNALADSLVNAVLDGKELD